MKKKTTKRVLELPQYIYVEDYHERFTIADYLKQMGLKVKVKEVKKDNEDDYYYKIKVY